MSIRKMKPDELKYCEIAARSHSIIIGSSVIGSFSTVQRYLSISGILSCLKKDAIVNEIRNGKRIQLNLSNYDIVEEPDEVPATPTIEEEKAEEKVDEETVEETTTTVSASITEEEIPAEVKKETTSSEEVEIIVDDETSTVEETVVVEEVENTIENVEHSDNEEVVEDKAETTETSSYNKNRKKKRH